jgi:hypothetical protein
LNPNLSGFAKKDQMVVACSEEKVPLENNWYDGTDGRN